MRTLLANIIKSAKKEIVTLVSAALLSGLAVGCEDGSRFEGKSLEEVVSMVDSVSEAQQFINDEIDYAYCDLDGSYQRPQALNGAEVQGFRRTFDRKLGVCRDGAVAVAAMLQDNGFPALILDSHWTGGEYDGHSVFVYQDEQGNWGSAGINKSDRRHNVFGSLEALARDIAMQYDGDYKGYNLYDLSLVNLIEGTNDGLVVKVPFTKTSTMNGTTINFKMEKTPAGYERQWMDPPSAIHFTYTDDLFLDSTHIVNPDYDAQWQVVMRAPCRLPSEELTTTLQNDETTTMQTWTGYTIFNKILELVSECRLSGVLINYKRDSRQYDGENLAVQTIEISHNGDYVIDNITQSVANSDGSHTIYYDANADGVWDSITQD